MSRSGEARGEGAFRDHYTELYGARWPELEEALRGSADSLPFRAAPALDPYYLDSASIYAAQSLELPKPGSGDDGAAQPRLVLDACAAPGGKSIVLATRLATECDSAVRLIANELSAARRGRLAYALDRHLPPELRTRVDLMGRDAASLCRSRPEAFDAILLDAPCSSERHVLADPSALEEWTPARSRNLAVRQWALLSSAFLMLRPGGCLVYSTCSLEPRENQFVVSRLEEKYAGSFRFDPPDDGPGEAAGPGVLILPDRAQGAGPMFVCRIRKL